MPIPLDINFPNGQEFFNDLTAGESLSTEDASQAIAFEACRRFNEHIKYDHDLEGKYAAMTSEGPNKLDSLIQEIMGEVEGDIPATRDDIKPLAKQAFLREYKGSYGAF
ncbi:hypothetical protein AWENTII_010919 [Aspergillus wentii]